MKAYQIKDIKNFMGKLLLEEAFDCFLLAEGSITTSNLFVIDGHIVKDFFDDRDASLLPSYEFSEWKNLRPLCFELIKGRRTPVNFRFVLHLKPQMVEAILQKGEAAVSSSDVRAFVLNIKYDDGMLTCITATAFYTFLPDKTPDRLWDEYISRFFAAKGISFEES